jgi:hypothetical protein
LSEYQYYEFQAIDRPLSEGDRQALRGLSTRARITATSFTNSYEWGDFKGDPAELMERWFDLHLYLANWGSRQLMIRLPKGLVDRPALDRFLGKVDCATVRVSENNLVLSIERDEVEPEEEGWDDGSGWLAALAPLRADVLAGDLRLFYLLWLTAVEGDALKAVEAEPMPGIGPLTASLEAFAGFFGLDSDLVQAAAECPAGASVNRVSPDSVRKVIADLPDHEKTGLLVRLFEGAPHVAAELRSAVRRCLEPEAPPAALRTVGELRARAHAIRLARERAEEDRAAAERSRQVEEAEKARRAQLDAIARRGESIWSEIETEIERRNAAGYDKASGLLIDLRAIAEERGRTEDFNRRLQAIRERHARKTRFIERLAAMG